jgi:hypothetical protein
MTAGGAEYDVEIQHPNAMDVRANDIHDRNDLRPFVVTVNAVMECPPGYHDIEWDISRP